MTSTAAERLLLLIDDRPAEARLLKAVAARASWRTLAAASMGEAMALLRRPGTPPPDAVLVRWDVAGHGSAIPAIVGHHRIGKAPILLLTAQDEMTAALRAGAADVLIEPVSAERLLTALTNLDAGLPAALRPLAEKIGRPIAIEEMVGTAPAFVTAMGAARRAARGDMPVLIEGAPGTGKESLAGAIHAASLRAARPFVVVNCRTVPRNVIDSELFGHEQGAFPGAFERRIGRAVAADGGTLFLDEVTTLPEEVQARLLRLVRMGEVRAIGATAPRRVDIRIIAGVDGAIGDAIEAGHFGVDLGRALAGARIMLPSLAERREDIPALATALLGVIRAVTGAGPTAISPAAGAILQGQDWPHNVRQLQSVLLRLGAHVAGTTLDADVMNDLARTSPPPPRSDVSAMPLEIFDSNGHLRPLEAIEADVIRLAIDHYSGRMSEVARRLGIGRSTLYRKLGELGIHEAA
jgi:DNA-binding NtrC family response regulator